MASIIAQTIRTLRQRGVEGGGGGVAGGGDVILARHSGQGSSSGSVEDPDFFLVMKEQMLYLRKGRSYLP